MKQIMNTFIQSCGENVKEEKLRTLWINLKSASSTPLCKEVRLHATATSGKMSYLVPLVLAGTKNQVLAIIVKLI
jgi:hypothetical protein